MLRDHIWQWRDVITKTWKKARFLRINVFMHSNLRKTRNIIIHDVLNKPTKFEWDVIWTKDFGEGCIKTFEVNYGFCVTPYLNASFLFLSYWVVLQKNSEISSNIASISVRYWRVNSNLLHWKLCTLNCCWFSLSLLQTFA